MRELDRVEILLLLIAVTVAAFFRTYRLDQVPPGLWRDEAANGVDALGVLQGHHPIFFEANNGREPLFIYLVAISVRWLGRNPLAVRLVSALTGTMTILPTYFMTKELVRYAGRRVRHTALLTTLWLALSYWHIALSRLGFRGILLPLLASLSFFFLWRGFNERFEIGSDRSSLHVRSFLYFAASGILLGLSFYTYVPSRLLPLVLLAFLAPLASQRHVWHADGYSSGKVTSVAFSLPLAFGVLVLCSAVVFAPLGLYFLDHPQMFWQRSADLLSQSALGGEAFPLSLATNLARQASMFGIQSDPNILFNPAARPAFELFTLVFFVAGILITLRHWRKVPFLFALLWLCIMLLPAALSAQDLPHSLRAIGTLPIVYLFPAIGLDWVWECLTSRWNRSSLRYAFAGIVAMCYIAMAFYTYRDYFTPTTDEYALWRAFDGRFVEMASVMTSLDEPESVWILPLTPYDAQGPPYSVIDFLHQGTAPCRYLHLQESTVGRDLSVFCAGASRAMVIEGRDNRLAVDAYADAKGTISFLLNKYGRLLETHTYGTLEAFQVSIYELPGQTSFSIADSFRPIGAPFGEELKLVEAAMGGSSQEPTSTSDEVNGQELPSGKNAWVVLRWEATGAPDRDYKVGVAIVDERRRRMGQTDKLLLSGNWQPTSRWEPGELEMDYYTLPSLPATPPGVYSIEVVVYDAVTMERLTVLDEREGVTRSSMVVGTLQLVKPLVPPQVEPMEELAGPAKDIAPGIRLLGYDPPARAIGPGQPLELALYWHALQDVHNDYVVLMELRDDEGHVWGQEESKPAYGSYPTTEWERGETIRDWHDMLIKAESPDGDYHLYVGIEEENELLRELELGTIHVSGRERTYEVPPMEQELGWTLGEAITLVGYDVDDTVKAGETLKVTLYWQCARQMNESYTVFTHLLDGENVIQGQLDSVPLNGEAPTTSWIEGEVIIDRYEIAVDGQVPAGGYVIEVGMYDPRSGERLPVHDAQHNPAGNRILLQEVDVRARS